jgi:very-short-patch-repair endonuclease
MALPNAAHHLAESRFGLLTLADLRGIGCSERAIQTWLRRGALIPVHRGVYRLPGTWRTERQRLVAACADHAPWALACRRTAGTLWQFDGVRPRSARSGRGSGDGPDAAGPEIEILVPRWKRRTGGLGRSHIVLHESRDIRPDDVAELDGIPLTSPTRTLLDLSAVIPPQRLGDALDDAVRRDLVTLGELHRRFTSWAKRGRPGVRWMRPLLEDRLDRSIRGDSPLEARLLDIIRTTDLPEPAVQIAVALDRTVVHIDMGWPALRLGIEADGLGYHADPAQFRWDRRRQNALQLRGWQLLRFTWHDATESQAATRRMIVTTYRKRSTLSFRSGVGESP